MLGLSTRAFARRGLSSSAALANDALAPLDPSRMTVTRNPAPKAPPDNAALKGMFGKIFSDHMFVCDHVAGEGWGAPAIVPHGPLALSPASMALHYALQCFEGMKAYRGDDGVVRLFRPDLNAARMTAGKAPLGFLNPFLYQLRGEGFTDITTVSTTAAPLN